MVEYSYCLFHYRLVDVELRVKVLSTALFQWYCKVSHEDSVTMTVFQLCLTWRSRLLRYSVTTLARCDRCSTSFRLRVENLMFTQGCKPTSCSWYLVVLARWCVRAESNLLKAFAMIRSSLGRIYSHNTKSRLFPKYNERIINKSVHVEVEPDESGCCDNIDDKSFFSPARSSSAPLRLLRDCGVYHGKCPSVTNEDCKRMTGLWGENSGKTISALHLATERRRRL